MNEMGKLLYTVLLTFQVIVYYSECCVVFFEAEYGTSNGVEQFRSSASNGITVLIKCGDKIEHTFQTNSSCEVSVTNIAYSNDGLSDSVSVTIDETAIGTFQSVAANRNGMLWDVFKTSGPIENAFEISPGEHVLTLTVTLADDYGVEIDKTTLSVVCANIVDIGPEEDCPKSVVNVADPIAEFGASTPSDSPITPVFETITPSDDSGDTGLTPGDITGIAIGIIVIGLAVPGTIVAIIKLIQKRKGYIRVGTS